MEHAAPMLHTVFIKAAVDACVFKGASKTNGDPDLLGLSTLLCFVLDLLGVPSSV